MDRNTFEHHTTTTTTDTDTDTDDREADPAAYRTRRCSTLSGNPIDVHDTIVAALAGHLRRVVFDTRGVVVESIYGVDRVESVTVDGVTIDATDHGTGIEDVAFDGSELRSVTVDATRFQRVDLRGATALDPVAVGDLDGCLITDAQAHHLATHLALAAGASLERDV